MTKLDTIEGIGPAYAEKLAAAGVHSTESLLRQGASKKGRKELASATEISEKVILRYLLCLP